jgi:hypothetical protein
MKQKKRETSQLVGYQGTVVSKEGTLPNPLCLFIGGPLDGRRINMPLSDSGFSAEYRGVPFFYRAHWLGLAVGADLRVFAPEAWSVEDIAATLFDGYHVPDDDEDNQKKPRKKPPTLFPNKRVFDFEE